MKINILRGVLILLLLCTFGLIFNFSSQDAPKSKSVSKQVTEGLVNTFHKKDNEKSKLQRIKQLEPIIRKCAHFSIYMVVGILLICLFNTYNLSNKKKIIICLGIGIIYACSDEIHQTFVNGRSGEVRDVLIDSSGVMVGIGLVYGIRKLWSKFHKKTTKNSTK